MESHLTGYPAGIADASDALDNLTLIGNTMSSTHWSFDANRMLIAGNIFNLPSINSYGGITLTSRNVSHFIGNEVNSATPNRTTLLTLTGELHFVVANRIDSDISIGASIQDGHYVMVHVNPNVHSIIKNNLLTYTLPAEHQPDPLEPLTASLGVGRVAIVDVSATNKAAVVENNTIDYGMDADTITYKFDSEVIETDSAITVRNNVVVNTTRDLVGFTNADAETNSVVEFNLCDNVIAEMCGADDDVIGDALFVDNDDYMAAAGSAAIDSGDPDGVFNDVDGTRNDLGVYGGTFPLDQYDVQRNDGRLEPYLYPLFEPNKAVSSDGKLNVRVVGLARSK